MVEVFKTNVKEPRHAFLLITQIYQIFEYEANFDLDDCDKILRVSCNSKRIEPELLITLLKKSGFKAEILPD